MSTLIIGNGFDLEHGLPTKYIDFINFMNNIYLSRDYQAFKGQKESDLKQTVSSDEYAYLNDKTNKNLWIKYFIKYKKTILDNAGWIDFELEISKIIQSLEYSVTISNKCLEKGINSVDYQQWRDKFYNSQKEFIFNNFASIVNDIDNTKFDNKILKLGNFTDKTKKNIKPRELIVQLVLDLNDLINCLKIYLCSVVQKIQISHRLPIEKLQVDRVLSFNYTNTFYRIYDNNNITKYCYIHGNVNTKEKMVLGINDYLTGDNINNNVEFVEFKKYYQRILNNNDMSYINWDYSNVNKNGCSMPGDVYFYGHSLDITDKDILNPIIMNKNVISHIFYNDEESHKSLIKNLIKIIGRDNLIEKTRSHNPTIEFISINEFKARA